MGYAKRNVVPAKAPNKISQTIGIIIPAAGEGSRMKNYGVKSLIKLHNNKTIIEQQLDVIYKCFNNVQVILVTGCEADKLMNHTPSNIIKIENPLFETTNVARSIGLGLRASVHNRILVVYGDLVFNKQTLSYPFNDESIIVLAKHTMSNEEVGCVIHDNYLEHMMYEHKTKWAQVAYFVNKELELLKTLTWNKNNYILYGFEIINKIIDRGGKFKCVTPNGIKVTDIDTSQALLNLKNII